MSQNDILRTAFEAVYDGTVDWATAADYVLANSTPQAHVAFVEQWREDEGLSVNDDPDTYMQRVRHEQAELDRVAEKVREGMAEKVRREEAERAQRIEDVITGLPLGKELAPVIYATAEREAEARDVTNLDERVALLADAYTDATTRHAIGENARFQAEASAPFRSTEIASGWFQQGGEQFPSAESVAAAREGRIQQRAASIYQQHAPDGLTQPTAAPSEEELRDQAARQFVAKNERSSPQAGLVRGERQGTTSQDAMRGFEQAQERSSSFHSASIEADAAAREGRQRKDFWNGTTDTQRSN